MESRRISPRQSESALIAKDSLISFRYESLPTAQAPIPVTVAPRRAPPADIHPALRRRRSGPLDGDDDASKRDSGLAPTTSTSARKGSLTSLDDSSTSMAIVIDFDRPAPVSDDLRRPSKSDSIPSASDSASASREVPPRPSVRSRSSETSTLAEMASPAITTAIPTDQLMDEEFLGNMSFSKRGSIMFGGKKGVKSAECTRSLPRYIGFLGAPPPFLLTSRVT